MTDLVPEKVLLVLAIDLGLLILMAWLVILFLMIREFRKFARQFTSNSALDDKTLVMCQESVDNALSYTSDNAETIEQLMKIQRALEAQLSKLEQSAQVTSSNDDQKTVNDLNGQLEESDRLIRKLKSDLDKSIKGLKVTKEKLFSQYETVDSLKSEKSKLESQYEQLEQEFFRMSQAAEANRSPNGVNGPTGNAVSKEVLDGHKKQLQSMRQELSNVQSKLQHAEKEKNFIEKRYMDMVKELESKEK